MSINNNSININSLNEKYKNINNYNNFIDKNIFKILEIESSINFEIISNDINSYNNKINFQKDNLNYNINENGDNVINNFLIKLYNSNSILTIDQYNLDEIFLLFKKILLTKINEYSASIIIDINNFEVKYNDINYNGKYEINNIESQNNENLGKEIVKNDFKNNTNIIEYSNNINRESEIKNLCNINDNVINKNDSYKLLKLVKCYSFNEKSINNKSLFYNIFKKEENEDSKIIMKSYSQDLNKYKNLFNEEKGNTQYINNNLNNCTNNNNINNNNINNNNINNNNINNNNINNNNINNNNINNNNLNNEDNNKFFNDIENKIKIEEEKENYEENNIIKDNGKTLRVESQLNYNENEKTKENGQRYNVDKIDINENTLKNINNNNNDTNKERDSLLSSNKDKIISQKLKELDIETLKFREERNKIMNLKNDYEKLQKQLIEDIEEFQRKKEQFEQYKQNETERLKKKKIYEIKNNFNINNNINNNKVLFNTKNDKEIIKLLKNQIKDLENVVKLKDCELRLYKNNKNPNIILKNNNKTTGKVYNNILSKKNFLSVKQNLDQAFSDKNIKNKNPSSVAKNKNSIKYINKNNMINNIYNNNHTINAKSPKNYFENINKKLSKLKFEKFMNISYTNHIQLHKKFNNNDNTNNNYINKNKINISFQQNNMKSKINSKKNIYDTDYKDINKKIIFHKEKNKKEVPKVKLDLKPKYNYDTAKIGEDILSDNFGDNKYSLMNSIIFKESQKTFSKEKIKPIKPLNKYFYSNMLVHKNNYNFMT